MFCGIACSFWIIDSARVYVRWFVVVDGCSGCMLMLVGLCWEVVALVYYCGWFSVGFCGLLLGFCYLCAGVTGLACCLWWLLLFMIGVGFVWVVFDWWGLLCDGCFGRVCVLV